MNSRPDKILNKRQSPRHSFKEAIRFQVGEYACPDGSLSKDLSHGGICLTINEFIPVKGQVIVYLKRGGESRVVTLHGVVAWVKIIPESERYQIGVQFCDLDESAQREVTRILVTSI